MSADIQSGSLVIYKEQAAKVLSAGNKLEIQLADGSSKSVRPKDVALLHAGPISSLAAVQVDVSGDVKTAWELLAGERTNLPELCDLLYGEFQPQHAWAAWQLILADDMFSAQADVLYDEIMVRDAEAVARIQAERASKAAEKAAWDAFVKRVEQRTTAPDDQHYLQSVEALALGQTDHSKVLKDLGRPVTPESAHGFLLYVGYWPQEKNPYPQRAGLPLDPPQISVSALPQEARLDLTHLAAFAIDDEGNQDPDDAISLDGETLWVHVADVAALVPPDSALDKEARARGANLYIPERIVPMLPPAVTEALGLGLQPQSPALSFALQLDEDGIVRCERIVLSQVQVTRLTYEAAETQMDQAPFCEMAAMTCRFRERRNADGAANLNLPEVKLKVVDDDIHIAPLGDLRSRDMVTNAMLMAGAAVADYANRVQLPIPYATQAPPDREDVPTDLAGMFAYRKFFKRSVATTSPGAHAGLGLSAYARATSPLRRYTDLLVHQQCRAHLTGTTPLDEDALLVRMSQGDMAANTVTRTERPSNRHWILIYLARHPDWSGEGVLVERRGKRAIVLIPEFGFETGLYVDPDIELNQTVPLKIHKVDLPNLDAVFKVDAT